MLEIESRYPPDVARNGESAELVVVVVVGDESEVMVVGNKEAPAKQTTLFSTTITIAILLDKDVLDGLWGRFLDALRSRHEITDHDDERTRPLPCTQAFCYAY